MKTILFMILIYGVSSSKIFEILAETGVKQCYNCKDDCQNPSTETCQNDNSKCYSVVRRIENVSEEARGCIDSIEAATICQENLDQLESCYTCDTDLCNNHTEEIDLGVEKCYVCVDQCSTPLAQHDCQEVLTAIEGKAVKAACLSYSVERETGLEISKGCIPDSTLIRLNCAFMNFNKGVSCTICVGELCNGEDGGSETSVEQCYFCENNCSVPVPTQNCSDVLGEGVITKCASIQTGDGTSVIRKCIEDSDETRDYCTQINQEGGECEICDTNLCNTWVPEDGGNETSVEQCYFCENNCSVPVPIQNCSDVLGEGVITKCASIQTSDGTSVIRKCVEDSDETRDYCTQINQEGGECKICDSNLCNTWVPEDGGNETSVEQCYFCENNCSVPVPTQNCSDVFGEGVITKCVSIQTSDDTSIIRKCIEDSNETRDYCTQINQEGGECEICDTNLCNTWVPEDGDNETSVEQCYFCENNCSVPVPTQNCADEFGEGVIAKCASIQTGDGTSVIRKCIEDSDETRDYCTQINQEGGECEICDTNLCNTWDPKDDGTGGSEQIYPLFCLLFVTTVFLPFA